MTNFIDIGMMHPEEADLLYRMIERVAKQMVCQDFEKEGHAEFFKAVSYILYESPKNHLSLVARIKDRPVGFIDIHDKIHICLFFVELNLQGRGIGRRLFEEATKHCYPETSPFFEVNSSLYAVPIYESLGFVQKSDVRLLNGIRFIEMCFNEF